MDDAARLHERASENLAEQAYRQLSDMILQRSLEGGTFVIEERLAERLKISRTPMREAILRLAAEGLLVKRGNRSLSVRTVTAAEFFQSHKVREWLDPEAVELAMGKVPQPYIEETRRMVAQLATAEVQERAHWEVDDRLHMMFATASGNVILAGIVKRVRVTTRLFEVSQPLRRVRKDGEEHLAILDAFAAGDVKVARKAMLRHTRNLVSDTLSVLRGIA